MKLENLKIHQAKNNRTERRNKSTHSYSWELQYPTASNLENYEIENQEDREELNK